MFNTQQIRELKSKIEMASAELTIIRTKIDELQLENKNLKEENAKLKLVEERVTEISEHKIKTLEESQKAEILKATRQTQEAKDKLEKDLAVANAKVKMLEDAFNNLGFDVKDSKEMMSELIKALGVKNQVQVIK